MVKGTRDATAATKPKKAKTKPDAPGAVPAAAAATASPPPAGHNSGAKPSRLTKEQERELFARHRETWKAAQNQQKLLDEKFAKIKGAIKADGFKVLHMDIADDYMTPKGEKKVHGHIRDRLWVAQMIGHALGRQMDLFDQPDRTPAADRAYEEGKTASIENQPRQCTQYHETTEQFREFMRGYNDHQEELVARVGRGGGELPQEAPFDTEAAPEAERKPSDYVAVDTASATVVSRDEFHKRLQGSAREVDAAAARFKQ